MTRHNLTIHPIPMICAYRYDTPKIKLLYKEQLVSIKRLMTEKSQSPLLLPTPQDAKIPSSRRAPMPTQGATSTMADTLSPQRPTTHPEEKLTDGDVSRINSRIGSLPNQTYIDRGCQQKERKEALVNLIWYRTPRKGYTILCQNAKC